MNKHLLPASIALALSVSISTVSHADISVTQLGQFKETIGACSAEDAESCTEISAYSSSANRLYVTNAEENGLRILEIDETGSLSENSFIDLSPYGGGPNSVAVFEEFVAVAIEAETKQDKGVVVIFDLDGNPLEQIEAGALPDMLTFTPNGQYLLVANEGEPNKAYDVDPEGSVTVIKTSDWSAVQADFKEFNDSRLKDVRIFGPNASVAQDLEPEYIAVDADSKTAWISLQENNALAKLDIASATITDIYGLGYKKHHQKRNAFDASNKDEGINIQNWPTQGMYQPDAIATYERDGSTFILTANEGDARDYDGYSEEVRVKDLTLDAKAFPNAETLQQSAQLGRLKTTLATGDKDQDGDHDEIYSYGARSFSIWNQNGKQVFDSGNQFEITIQKYAESDQANWVDSRSDDKGPEPESITTGTIAGETYAFIGAERTNDIFIYKISNPSQPSGQAFVNLDWRPSDYANENDPFVNDIGPEGLLFVDDKGWLIVTSEISNTVSVYKVNVTE